MKIRIWIGVLALFLATPSFAGYIPPIPGDAGPTTEAYLVYHVMSSDGFPNGDAENGYGYANFSGWLYFNDFRDSLRQDRTRTNVFGDLFAYSFSYGGMTYDNSTHVLDGMVFFINNDDLSHNKSAICIVLSQDCRPESNPGRLSAGYSAGESLLPQDGYFFQPKTGPVDSPIYVSGPYVVPVPAAVWLFGSGLLGLVGIARRKKTA